MDKVLGLFGMAKRAGFAEIGEKPAQIAVASKKARAVFSAADAADNTVRKSVRLAQEAGVPYFRTPYAKEELGLALGRSSCALAAVTDAGLAAAIVRGLAVNDPERFREAATVLSAKSERILRRRGRPKKKQKGENM